MEKYYKVEFTAHLHRLVLALKMDCTMEIIWKRGQKIAQSGQAPLEKGQVKFDKKISINCNMIYDTKAKAFKEKITKFVVLIFSERGTKQAGQIEFDVSSYINEKQLHRKQYELKLNKCPDKNAKINFTISGSLKQQISQDLVSQSSYSSSALPSMLEPKSSVIEQKSQIKCKQTPNIPTPKEVVPTSDKQKPVKLQGNGSFEDKIKYLQAQNKKMREQLKQKQKIERQNEELKKKIQNQEFKSIHEMKKKLQNYRKETQKTKVQIRSNKQTEQETNHLENQILKCKIKMMKAFNYAAQFGGSQLVDQIQQFCGIHQK